PGPDDFTGYGLVDAYRATVGFARLSNQTNVADGFESGYLGQNWDTYTTGAGRVQVRSDAGPASGSYHLTLDTEYGQNPLTSFSINSLTEAVLHVPAAGVNNLVLSFKEREWSDDDHPLPA